LNGKDVVIVKSGIGKVSAATATAVLLSEYDTVEYVINLGVCGGLKKGTRQGDVIVANHSVQHDYDLTPVGLPIGQVEGQDEALFAHDKPLAKKISVLRRGTIGDENEPVYHFGTVASGDQFVSCNKKSKWIQETFSAIAVDMETAAIAQVCKMFNVKFLSLRTVSDRADDNAIMSYEEFEEMAAKRSIEIVKDILGT
ncbi:MAG: 5'-methylthioadenosine/adenosylhomocysteine nucleosidase, partial [Firmicutes bacterium]|nr:5'-methylthioadenosine/adenosylhomocysteine nucleosidase [Bacillota bacterium]